MERERVVVCLVVSPDSHAWGEYGTYPICPYPVFVVALVALGDTGGTGTSVYLSGRAERYIRTISDTWLLNSGTVQRTEQVPDRRALSHVPFST